MGAVMLCIRVVETASFPCPRPAVCVIWMPNSTADADVPEMLDIQCICML